jgi:SAM-dependent methyltransferase
VSARRDGVSFQRTVTIGRQSLGVPIEETVALGERLGVAAETCRRCASSAFAEEFLQEVLGAKETVSLDRSRYQEAALELDLNQPLPAELRGRFDALIDGGTLEHVFDVRRALANYMTLVRPGGHVFLYVPANNVYGHGFYQFSSELFFRVFAPENGFEVRELLAIEAPLLGRSRHWRGYRAVDPAGTGKRVRLVNSKPVLLLVHTERTAEIEPFATPPMQSYYAAAWDSFDQSAPEPAEADGAAPFAYLGRLEEWWRRARQRRKASLRNRRFFTPVPR